VVSGPRESMAPESRYCETHSCEGVSWKDLLEGEKRGGGAVAFEASLGC
jgi:hypothetical protein